MATANIYDHTGKKTKSITLPAEVFEAKVSPKLITQALHVFRTNQSQGSALAQTRGDVSYTKAKVYRQKGTGNARHGAKSAPIFVGGGVAHGPKAEQPGRKKLNVKMRRLSLIAALSQHATNGTISIMTDLAKLSPKTSDLHKTLAKIGIDSAKTLILTKESYPKLKQAAKNVKTLTLRPHNLTNVYQLLNTKHLVIDENSLKPISTWLSVKKSAPAVKKTVAKPKSTK